MKTNTDLFEKAPVPKAVATMAIPTMISMLVVVIYNMADTFFIGQTKDPMQVAAVSLATPVFMIFMALGHLFGIGGSSAISRALGERRKDRAWHISSFCCYGLLGLGITVAVFSVLGMNQILHLIGASENTIGFARQYLTIIAVGAPLKSNMLVVLLQIGLCVGIQPLIGYNYGSRNKKRLMQVFKFTGVVSVAMGMLLTLFMIVARKTMIQVFIDDAEVVAYGIRMVVALQLSAPFIGILFLCINTIQGMGKALPSLILTVCRQGLIFIPLIFLLNSMFGLDGVIYAQPTADYLSILVGIVICAHLFRSMEHRENENSLT